MPKKSFFKQRTISKIRDFKTSTAYQQKGLVNRITNLNPNKQGLILRCQLNPGKFSKNAKDSQHASRKCFRDSSSYLKLPHPTTKGECDESSITPLQLRQQAFTFLKGKGSLEGNTLLAKAMQAPLSSIRLGSL